MKDQHEDKLFDVILLENMIMAYHHLKDVVIIARLFSFLGRSVAIYDLYGLKDFIPNGKIPLFEFKINRIYRFIFKNTQTLWGLLLFLLIKRKYLKKFLKETKRLTKSYYVGSYGNTITSVFLKSDVPCFFWGLRSHNMNVRYWITKNPIMAYIVWRNKKLFLRGNNYLFVSNQFIEDEFKQLGIPSSRIVRREERIVEEPLPFERPRDESVFRYLVIGQLRPDKRVEMIIDAFNEMNDSETRLDLIGKAEIDYEKVLDERIGNNPNIQRINSFIKESDYNDTFLKVCCTVFADRQKFFSITNGTFIESLINYRPVIAPNYNPYKYYVEKFNIGILYNPDEPGSLLKALVEIKSKGVFFFRDNISYFLTTLSVEKVAETFKQNLPNLTN